MPSSPAAISNALLQQLLDQGIKDPKELAILTGTHLATIYRRFGSLKSRGTLARKEGTGSTPKFCANSRHRLYRLAIKNPLLSNTQLAMRMQEKGNRQSRWTSIYFILI